MEGDGDELTQNVVSKIMLMFLKCWSMLQPVKTADGVGQFAGFGGRAFESDGEAPPATSAGIVEFRGKK